MMRPPAAQRRGRTQVPAPSVCAKAGGDNAAGPGGNWQESASRRRESEEDDRSRSFQTGNRGTLLLMTAPLDRFGQTLEYFGFCPCHNQLLSAGDKGGTPTSGESLSLFRDLFFFLLEIPKGWGPQA